MNQIPNRTGKWEASIAKSTVPKGCVPPNLTVGKWYKVIKFSSTWEDGQTYFHMLNDVDTPIFTGSTRSAHLGNARNSNKWGNFKLRRVKK